MERYVGNARHIEVQILGDQFGNVDPFGRARLLPATASPENRRRGAGLRRAARSAHEDLRCGGNPGAQHRLPQRGTIEFIYDNDTADFYFLEMNTRIQVEHPVTEMITGVDLVGQQLRIARGEPLPFKQADIKYSGHAIECRINAESPQHGFRPCPGRITEWQGPVGAGIRLDTHCYPGYFVPPYYDSLLAKLIVHGATRKEAADRTLRALENFHVSGIDTLIPFLQTVIAHPEYRSGAVNTRWLEKQLEAYSAAPTA